MHTIADGFLRANTHTHTLHHVQSHLVVATKPIFNQIFLIYVPKEAERIAPVKRRKKKKKHQHTNNNVKHTHKKKQTEKKSIFPSMESTEKCKYPSAFTLSLSIDPTWKWITNEFCQREMTNRKNCALGNVCFLCKSADTFCSKWMWNKSTIVHLHFWHASL